MMTVVVVMVMVYVGDREGPFRRCLWPRKESERRCLVVAVVVAAVVPAPLSTKAAA